MKQKTIKQRESFLAKVAKIGTLLAIKESYLLLRNVWGLKSHPFKTIRIITIEKDRSQELLMILLPLIVLGLGLMMVGVGRWLIGAPEEWGVLAKVVLGIVTGGAVIMGGYLAYWWREVRRVK